MRRMAKGKLFALGKHTLKKSLAEER